METEVTKSVSRQYMQCRIAYNHLYISPKEKVYVGITIDERRRRACWFHPGPYSGFMVAAARKKYPLLDA